MLNSHFVNLDVYIDQWINLLENHLGKISQIWTMAFRVMPNNLVFYNDVSGWTAAWLFDIFSYRSRSIRPKPMKQQIHHRCITRPEGVVITAAIDARGMIIDYYYWSEGRVSCETGLKANASWEGRSPLQSVETTAPDPVPRGPQSNGYHREGIVVYSRWIATVTV